MTYTEPAYPEPYVPRARLVARWESRGGAYIVELWKPEGSHYQYRSNRGNGRGEAGIGSTDAEAVEYMERPVDGCEHAKRFVDTFQDYRNRTPMRRVRIMPCTSDA